METPTPKEYGGGELPFSMLLARIIAERKAKAKTEETIKKEIAN
jgi:hypothetical protein